MLIAAHHPWRHNKLTHIAELGDRTCRKSFHKRISGVGMFVMLSEYLALVPATALAIGTNAGANILNTATVNFDVNGTSQTPVVSNTVTTLVDELLDVVVVDDTGGPVAVSSPDGGVLLQFTITNNGNGTETFRVIADETVSEGGGDPVLERLYLESNGTPGLQIGSDTEYVAGITADPVLAEDESIVVYVSSDIPGSLTQGDNGDVSLRAISRTLLDQTGIDDPTDGAWPVPGDSFAALGDGGGDAVVGLSHDTGNLLLQDIGRYQISAAVVSIAKTSVNVVDPIGGATLVPGSIITYRLEVTVAGTGNAENLVVGDVLPAELDYQLNSIEVDGVAEDDDFAPAGTDNSGFNTQTTSLVIDRGVVTGGGVAIVITYDAAIR